MNIDRCHGHVPTAPGQSVCTCLDHIMWLRFCVEVMGEVIADLNAQLHGAGTPVVYTRDVLGRTTSVAEV